MLTRSLANDYGPQGVRANCVCPGWVRTPMGDDGMEEVVEKWGCSLEDAYWLCARDTPLATAGGGGGNGRGDRVPGGHESQLHVRRNRGGRWRGMAVDISSTAFHGPQQRLRDLLA